MTQSSKSIDRSTKPDSVCHHRSLFLDLSRFGKTRQKQLLPRSNDFNMVSFFRIHTDHELLKLTLEESWSVVSVKSNRRLPWLL